MTGPGTGRPPAGHCRSTRDLWTVVDDQAWVATGGGTTDPHKTYGQWWTAGPGWPIARTGVEAGGAGWPPPADGVAPLEQV